MARNPHLTIADLERIIERRRSQVSELTRERDRLQRQLDAVDDKIRDLAGKAGVIQGGTGRRRRAVNGKSLIATMEEVLEKSGRPMKVGEIVDAIIKSGYQSYASNFRGLVNQTLIRERKRFANTDRATYQLKK